MKRTLAQKLFSVLASLSIILQSIYPGALLLSRPAFAEDATPSADTTVTPEATPTADTTIATESATPVTDSVTPEAQLALSVPASDSTPEASSPAVAGETTVVETQNDTPHGNLSATIIKHTDAGSLTLNLDSQTAGSATVSTDKADYAPTDTVVITGSNFIPNQTYQLEISSTDPPTVNFSTSVATDENGSFIYAYQLDGNYRPNYKIEVKDASGTVIATTTFTDSRTVITATVDGSKTITVSAEASISVSVNVDYTNDWRATQYRIGSSGGWTKVDHSDHLGSGSATENFNITAPSSSGTYDLELQACKQNNCSGPSSDASLTLVLTGAIIVTASSTGNPSADLDQWGNEAPVGWQNGNLNGNQADYFEGDSVAYRMKFDNLSLSSHTITIGWDTTKGGKHALDYLTSYDLTEITDPCSGVSGCAGPASTFAIPVDPNIPADANWAGSQIPGNFSLFGGTITGVSSYTLIGPYSGDSETQLTVTFTPSQANPVLAWGGHIATRTDWGQDNSAISISGSPYHMRLRGLDGSGGNQDRSLASEAVIYPASITIIKDATPNGSTSFPFTASPLPLTNFSLVDDGTSGNTQTFSGITAFTNQQNSPLYTITENTPAGWTFGSISCSATNSNGGSRNISGATVSINLQEGEDVTCTYTNTRQNGTLTVNKVLLPSQDSGFFNLQIDGSTAGTGADVGNGGTTGAVSVSPGSHTVGEIASTSTDLSNYTSVFAGDCDPQGNVSVPAGTSKTCTITNTRIPKLTVIKAVTNDNGGTKQVSGFPLFVDGNSVTSGVTNTFSIGGHVVSETGDTNYTATFSGDCDAQGNVTLAAGDNKTCTITNNDIQPKLTVTKVVVNDNGGTKQVSDFPLFVGQTGVISGVQNGFNAGTYTVSETNQAGYTGVISGNCASNGSIALAIGDVKSCTITNDDNSPNLKLVKNVINDDGGTAVSHNWMLTATSNDDPGFTDYGDSTTFHPVKANTSYVLSESEVSGYTSGNWSCNEGTLNGNTLTMALGQHVTCTMTNDDVAPTVTLIKDVINDNGGSAGADDFGLTIGGNAVGSGQTLPVQANTNVALNEAGLTGYGFVSITGEGCPAQLGGTVNLAPGQNITCTITNDDVSPHLIVIKHVINDNGGSAVAGDFTMNVDAANVSQSEFAGAEDPGTELTLDAGDYSVSENQLPGYTANYSDDCEGTIEIGETKTCTITNNDDVPSLTLVKTVTNDNGGQAVASTWTLTATGPTSISGVGGFTSDATFAAGTYALSESVGPSGYTAGSWTCLGGTQNGSSITVGLGENATCTITNDDQPGQIKIIKNTIGGDGVFGFTVSGPTPLTPSVTTSSSTGNTGFLTVAAGSYSISETVPTGWDLTSSSCDSGTPGNFTVLNGGTVTCTFTDTKRGHIIIKKNAVPDGSQAFTLNNDFGNGNPATFNLTDDSTPGLPSYDAEVLPGTYSVSEGSVAGWQSPESATCDDQSPVGAISVQPGETVTCTFTNEKLAKITLVKNTVGGDGTFDFDAAGAGLPADIDLTTSGGTASQIFENLDPDNTYSISENVPDGWDLTDSNCTGTNTPASITPNAGEEITCTFTNANNPILTISKSNDASGDKHPGDSVTFKITVTDTQGTAYNVHVVDLPAGGFTYRAGSWTGTTTEPTYASPGKWSLGTMTAGQTITLTYIADISGGQQSGLYKDLAWASGCKINSDGDCSTKNTFLASTVAPGIVTDTFVGTQVNVVKDQGSTTHVNIEGQVLGAAIYLPATGGRTIWVVLASLLVSLGALLMALGRSRLVKGILPALAVGIALFTFAPQAQAANVSVRIEAPKSPTNQDSFNVNFVTLDTLGRDITVKCFKQAPGDGSPSQFGSDIVLSGGGNSGNCVINNGVISAQGTYQFSVTAQSGADPVESSNTVLVEYKTSNGPDTPVSYTKEQNSSCQFKIKFKTANDGGRTVRVEVYRSTTTSFAIDDSTKVGSVGIGSDTEGSLTNDVPDCSKTYYYAVRAYDSAGNGSGVIGDSVTTTIPGPVFPAPAGAIPVSGGTGTGAVLGGESSSTETGGILGETTPSAIPVESPASNNSFLSSKKTLAILGLIVLAAVYVFYHRGKQV